MITCPPDTVAVVGDYCPVVSESCEEYVNPDKPYVCAEFGPSRCLSKERVHMEFCIDRYEYPNIEGSLPDVEVSYMEAKAKCEERGERLCSSTEATFACEGPDMWPYPYGFTRDANICNIDNLPIDPWIYNDKGQPVAQKRLDLIDNRVASGDRPLCVSPFGVYDIVGNADEWVTNVSGHPYVSGLFGGHWVRGARNQCRALTTAHGPAFKWYISGFRCCADGDRV